MLCEGMKVNVRAPCRYPARFMVIAPVAPRVVCGYHARAYLKDALIPIRLFGRELDVSRLPDINGFLRAMADLGCVVTVTGTSIVINVRSKVYGNESKSD